MEKTKPFYHFFLVLVLGIVMITGFGHEGLVGVASNSFDVLNFGAVGNGHTDDSQAFMKAWQAVCGAKGGIPTLLIPRGRTFMLKPVNFEGPCFSNSVHVQISGTIIAPSALKDWENCHANSWIIFSSVNNLVIDGSGTINGQGSIWWSQPELRGLTTCNRPKALFLNNCANAELSKLNHVNSPRIHISIDNSNGVKLSQLKISAPQSSPNTDGIDISSSSHVNIRDCFIGTGDDCIAIKGNSSYINITGVACGPGHGISVGSLGEHGCHDAVEEVHVQYCNFTETMYGARIKTWEGGSGYARNIFFEQIKLIESKNPIVIDQFYCNGRHPCPRPIKPSAVAVSNVTYKSVGGTCASEEAIVFNCASLNCTNIVMDNVRITSSVLGKQVVASCSNAQGKSTFTAPKVPCLINTLSR